MYGRQPATDACEFDHTTDEGDGTGRRFTRQPSGAVRVERVRIVNDVGNGGEVHAGLRDLWPADLEEWCATLGRTPERGL